MKDEKGAIPGSKFGVKPSREGLIDKYVDENTRYFR